MLNDFFHNAFKLALLLSNFSFADAARVDTISLTTLLATSPATALFILFMFIIAVPILSAIGLLFNSNNLVTCARKLYGFEL